MARNSESRDAALKELVSQAGRRAYYVAYDLLRDRVAAEDAVQEALVKACEQLERVEQPQSLPSWFCRVVTNHCLSILRRRKRWAALRRLWPFASADSLHDEPAASADDVAMARDQGRELMLALDTLPMMQRVAITLRYGHEMSVDEVAGALGVGAGTVKTHLHRGLSKLRTRLGAGADDE